MTSNDASNMSFLFDKDYDKDTANDGTPNADGRRRELKDVNLFLGLTKDSQQKGFLDSALWSSRAE